MKTKQTFHIGILIMVIGMVGASFTAQGQVTVRPKTHSAWTKFQNDLGRVPFIPVWTDSWVQTEDYVNQVLVVTHRVYFDGNGRIGQRGIIEVYLYTLGRFPIGGEKILLMGYRKDGSWIASTNVIPASQMWEISWEPDCVGSRTEQAKGSRTRTLRYGSSYVANTENLANRSQLLRFNCSDRTRGFKYQFSHGARQKMEITLSIADCTGQNTDWNLPLGTKVKCGYFDIHSYEDFDL